MKTLDTKKIIFLTNNSDTYELYQWIKDKYPETFLIEKKVSLNDLEQITPHLIVSYGYRYIIKPNIIERYKGKIINLHISYLPWNKGAYPNLWSFLEGTPHGVTIHLIDEGIDTGDILFQKKIVFNENKETLSSSYNKLQKEIKKLFKENWEQIKELNWNPKKQEGKGSIHYIKDFKAIEHILGKEKWNIPIVELKKRYNFFIEKKK